MSVGPWSVLLLFILLLSLCMCRSQPLAVCLVQTSVRLYSDHPRIFGLELDYFPSSLMMLCCSNASCSIEQISVLPTAPLSSLAESLAVKMFIYCKLPYYLNRVFCMAYVARIYFYHSTVHVTVLCFCYCNKASLLVAKYYYVCGEITIFFVCCTIHWQMRVSLHVCMQGWLAGN